MAEIVTAVYDSRDKVTNAVDDLLSTGIPLEKIRVHEEKPQVQVSIADVAEAEITEILQRHQPLELHT
jgi:hypothetical protein